MVLKGWPDKRDVCPEMLKPYWTYRDELSVLDGLVLKGTRIIIPIVAGMMYWIGP